MFYVFMITYVYVSMLHIRRTYVNLFNQKKEKFETTSKELFLDSANIYRSNTLTHWKSIVNEVYQ